MAIHDSPYGVWNIANFTLEELTLPNFSGEDARFRPRPSLQLCRIRFNTNPKFGETNAPLITTIESTNGTHIVFACKRRLEPTDVGLRRGLE